MTDRPDKPPPAVSPQASTTGRAPRPAVIDYRAVRRDGRPGLEAAGMVRRVEVTRFDAAAFAAARATARLTQQQLADRVGVGRSVVAQWEKGHRGISIRRLRVAAEVLDVDPAQLQTHTAEPTLQEMRVGACLTQAEVAAAAILPRGTYAALERGAIISMSEVTAQQLSAALRTTPDEVRAALRRTVAAHRS